MHSGKVEFLALKWAITDKFRDYLYYSPPFDVFTDNNPLTYVLTTARLNAATLHWVRELADFKFKIHYCPGRSNLDADALSRSPLLDMTKYISSCTEQSSPEEINAVINSATLVASGDTAWINAISDPDTAHFANNHIPDEQTTRDNQYKFDLKDAQIKDKSLNTIIQYLKQNQRPSPTEIKALDHNTKQLLYDWKKLKLSEDDTLRRISGQYDQVVLPLNLCNVVYSELHTNMGHSGPERVVQLARERFFWPHMQRDITNFITRRSRCVKQKPPAFKQREPLTPINSTSPCQISSIDYLHLQKSSGGYEHILIIVDHFTRYAQAYGPKDESGKTAARLLFTDFMLR